MIKKKSNTAGYLSGIAGAGVAAGMGTAGYLNRKGNDLLGKKVDDAINNKSKKLTLSAANDENAYKNLVKNYKGSNVEERFLKNGSNGIPKGIENLMGKKNLSNSQKELLDSYKKYSSSSKKLSNWVGKDATDKALLKNRVLEANKKKIATKSLKTGGKIALGTTAALGTAYGELYDHYKKQD